MNKKVFATVGMIVCAVLIVVGFVMIGQGNECSHAYSSSYYDSGFTTFGADFYTYSSNNTAEAASAARTTANNLYELYDLVGDAFGWLFVFAGLIGLCHFGILRADCPNVVSPDMPVAREPLPVAMPMEETEEVQETANDPEPEQSEE